MSDVKKVLVIDDDVDILESVSLILKNKGIEVVTAENNDEGLTKAKETNPDIIFCDMMMEDVDGGLIFMRAIKEENLEIPVYLMSSVADATTLNIDLNKEGFKGVLQKPVTSEQLLKIVL